MNGSLQQSVIAVLTLLMAAVASVATVERPPLARSGPNPEAPAEISQFGRFEGDWTCLSTDLQPDGSWKQTPGEHHWSWYYILDGYAVEDVWRPARSAKPDAVEGVNLRVYDPKTGLWDVVWTTQKTPRLDRLRAAQRADGMHIYADRPGGDSYPPHLMHITFHNIGPTHFDWKYETSALVDGQHWREVQRLSCDRRTPAKLP